MRCTYPLIGGPLSMGLLLLTVLQGNGSMMTKGLILGWLGSRFLGLVGWLVLSYAFLTGGRPGLVQLSWKWWLCLMAGVPAAVFLLWFFYILTFNGGSYHLRVFLWVGRLLPWSCGVTVDTAFIVAAFRMAAVIR